MEQYDTDIVVLGCGAAGAAIGCVLAQFGKFAVTVVYRGEEEGSSFSNQKWKHSGALYPNRELAQEAWDSYTMARQREWRYLLGFPGAHLLSHDAEVLQELQVQWTAWDVARWGLRVDRIELPPSPAIGSFGRTCLIGGFLTPDCILDFPRMIRDLRLEMGNSGVVVEGSASVRKIVRDGNRITGVVLDRPAGEIHLRCRHCIVAMGAWSLPVLADIGVCPPVRLSKSNVLLIDGELVDRITVWIRHELTIVPYRGQTLVCDARFLPVSEPDDLDPHWPDVEGLLTDLGECFPAWKPTYRSVRGCIKTSEIFSDGLPNPRSVIYSESTPDRYRHGVKGLTVVFPGKASFMWRVAEDVLANIISELGSA